MAEYLTVNSEYLGRSKPGDDGHRKEYGHRRDGDCQCPEAKPEGQYCGTRRNKYVQQSQCGPLDRPVGEHQAPQLIDEILHALAKLSLACRGDKTIDTSALAVIVRSEDRRVGTGCVSTCISRWSPSH